MARKKKTPAIPLENAHRWELAEDHHRLVLGRRWVTLFPRRRALFIGLNPSTGDGRKDDPTLRRMVGFAQREGADELLVVNLLTLRTPDPKDLLRAYELGEHLVHPGRGDRSVFAQLEPGRGDLVVACWGSHPYQSHQGGKRWGPVQALMQSRIAWWVGELNSRGHQVLAFDRHGEGECVSGPPPHPLYLRKETPLRPWRWGQLHPVLDELENERRAG